MLDQLSDNFASNMVKADGLPLLCLVASTRQFDSVERLLSVEDLDVDARDIWGRSALLHTAEVGDRRIVECLLDNGADIDLADRCGKTVLIIAAARWENEGCAETYTKNYALVTPSGMISYVSKAYGVRVSDKAIFKRSRLIDRMIRGVDQIMIDRGFLIERECAEFGIKIIRPPFLRKKKKFSANEATSGADISSARVHVERRIKRVREFVIMRGPLSTEIVPYIYIITKVICAYSNLCSPILSEVKFRAQY
ncbi:hypothetical protein TKK_0012073 [Trichogramma kaykai]